MGHAQLISLLALVPCTVGAAAWWLTRARHVRSYRKLERAQRQSAALLELSLRSGQRFSEMTELASRAAEVHRVGIWLLSEDESELRCADAYDATNNRHEQGAAFEMSRYPKYLESLSTGLTLVAPDAREDERTSEFREVYLVPLGVTSTLDAAVRASGRLVGVVRFEHVGPVRQWREDEVRFAGAVADQVAQALLDAQREKAVGELRESEQRMTLAAEAARLGIWVWELATNQVWMNDNCRRIFGFPPRCEITQEDVLRRIHPDDRQAVDRATWTALVELSRYEIEGRLLLPDGTMRWISARGAVTVDAAGEPVRIQGVSADITTRKEAEERFRRVVEAAPNAMILIDSGGIIRLVNGQTEAAFGYGRDELVGRPIELLIPERYRPDHVRRRKSYFANPVTRVMGAGHDLFGLRRDGSEFPIEVGVNPVPSSEGPLVLTSVLDITARRRAEAQALSQRNELARLSRLTLLGELSGSLAHELNQPLMSILSNAQAAQRLINNGHTDLEEVRAILKDIVEADKRAGEVIRRLRLLLTKGELLLQELDLNDLVQDVLKIVRGDLAQHDVVVDTEFAASLPRINGDRVQLQQVILNLILNGCDAMAANDAPERRLRITTEANGNGIYVSIADLGCGIPTESVEKVFEPFYTTKPHGTGLGLSICRTIVTAHSGRLWASNNPEKGASFHLYLPRIETSGGVG
jgi:PAS domain S-box-containing protein